MRAKPNHVTLQSPMVPNSQLKNDSESFDDPKAYRRLVRELNYLIVTHHIITDLILLINSSMM